MRCALPDTAAFEPLFPSIKNAAEERARAQYYRGSLEPVATRQINSGNTISLQPKCGYLSLYQFEQGVLANHLLDGLVKQMPVRLYTGAPYRTALGPIEHAIMNRRSIRGPSDDSVKSIHLPNQMTFAQAADSRVTTHRSDLVDIKRDKRNARTHARSSAGCFDAGVTATDYNYIELVHANALMKARLRVKGPCFT